MQTIMPGNCLGSTTMHVISNLYLALGSICWKWRAQLWGIRLDFCAEIETWYCVCSLDVKRVISDEEGKVCNVHRK